MWRMVAGMMSRPDWSALAITRFASSPLGLNRVWLAPCSRYTLSASSIKESSSLRPQYSSRLPPNSGVSVSLPSLKAPAPPQPQTTLQGWQCRHSLAPFFSGQTRLSIARPLSSISTFLPCFVSSSAAKSPAGPAPAIMTSYLPPMAIPPLSVQFACPTLISIAEKRRRFSIFSMNLLDKKVL